MNTSRAILIALLVSISLSAATPARAAERPNILVILTDDQGWGDLSVHGNTNLSTPAIDSLARDGALFERFFVCPVCSPTRAEFLTGRYHPRGGVFSTSTGGEMLDLDERTIGDVFKAAGYATAAFGKWHNGSQYPYHPRGRGFDEYYGFPSGHWGEYFDPQLEHNGKIVKGRGFIVDDLTDHAIDFMASNRERPFFCYLPLNTPHSPMQVPDRFYEKFRNADLKLRATEPNKEDLEMTRAALAMCENIDWNVGRLLKSLDDLKLAQRTIVLYFADNGPNSKRWNGDMRGVKASTDEGGVRSPLLVRWPEQIRPGTKIPQIAGAIDLLPTLADLTGIPLSLEKPLDGKSLKPLLTGSAENWPDREIFTHWAGNVSVRTQQYRFDSAGRLCELANDAGQRNDLAAERPEVAARLKASVAKWRREVLVELTKEDRPFPVGYREMPAAMLPARDGVAHGGIQRSAKAPNCSFFTHWTSLDDSITWDIAVATAGRYEAVVYQTCAKENVGATIELSLGPQRVAATITQPHDPPLRGEEHDRVSRGTESFVKDFLPVKLGVLQLEPGRGPLTLRALKISGPAAIDVRGVVLTLLD